MELKLFERLVRETVEGIADKTRDKIKNVAILVEYEPSKRVLQAHDVHEGWTLFGLYEGIPLTERGEQYGIGETLPDRITIFQGPIEDEAKGDPEKIRKIIKETLDHEIAHYFGMDEYAVQTWERLQEINKKNMDETTQKNILPKVLLAEDDDFLAETLKAKFVAEGFDVTVASDGERVLDALAKESFSILLLDLLMPKVSGFDILSILHAKHNTIPIVVTSNLGSDEDRKRAMELGVLKYFVKSDASTADIVDGVKSVLRGE